MLLFSCTDYIYAGPYNRNRERVQLELGQWLPWQKLPWQRLDTVSRGESKEFISLLYPGKVEIERRGIV